MGPLLAVISNNKRPPASSQWLQSWIKSQSLASLNSMIRVPGNNETLFNFSIVTFVWARLVADLLGISQLFVESYPDKIPILVEFAKQFNLSLDEKAVASSQKQLQEQLW